MRESRHCFADSRRLTGPNLFFDVPGAVLEALGPAARDDAAHARWYAAVAALRQALGWPAAPAAARRHAGGAQLALAAPPGLLLAATELNEWAWEAACGLFDGGLAAAAQGLFERAHPAGLEAMAHALAERAGAEFDPALAALQDASGARGLPVFSDDEAVSVGAGRGSRCWPRGALPDAGSLPWSELHDLPVALVTGSNGKTTTARLVAALLGAEGRCVGLCGTEGVTVGDAAPLAVGDYAGPAGARLVLRDPRVEAAVLETARGGILRRGLAVQRADVAVVTNLSADHFGEYGIDTLHDLADAKLVVARALGTQGLLVLNADNALLLARAPLQRCRVALFALDEAHPALAACRAAGAPTCGVAAGRLRLWQSGAAHDLGAVAAMPLSHGGVARHNVANLAAAALAAAALGVAPETIARTLSGFGRDPRDNPGRLERHAWQGAAVLVDYAHNPEGLAALLGVAAAVPGRRRLSLLLGQAGNRDDAAIAELARTAAAAAPDRIVLKELPAMLRGRAPGEVPALLRRALRDAGVPGERIELVPDEAAAARMLLAAARPGDVIVLPLHDPGARAEIAGLLEARGSARD